MLRCIFLTKLSDMTYGFRIFPSNLIKEIKWQELKHPFLLETIFLSEFLIKTLKAKSSDKAQAFNCFSKTSSIFIFN